MGFTVVRTLACAPWGAVDGFKAGKVHGVHFLQRYSGTCMINRLRLWQ